MPWFISAFPGPRAVLQPDHPGEGFHKHMSPPNSSAGLSSLDHTMHSPASGPQKPEPVAFESKMRDGYI